MEAMEHKNAEMVAAPCGCKPGSFYCPEAERLWRLYMAHLNAATAAISAAERGT